jgi:hypothetical protein
MGRESSRSPMVKDTFTSGRITFRMEAESDTRLTAPSMPRERS